MSVDEINENLNNLYEKYDLREDKCVLAGACSNSCKWESPDKRRTPPVGAYVGEEYEKHRILFVAINYNYDSLAESSEDEDNLFDYVQKYVSRSKETINSRWIDGAIHAVVERILGENNLSPDETKKCFAYTNVVKCSVSKNAGMYTRTMFENCAIRQAYVFKEIDILRPQQIIAFGRDPFEALKSNFASTIQVTGDFQDWLFRFQSNGRQRSVIRLYNPGQGYRYIRKEWKSIKQSGSIGQHWRPFFPDQLSNSEIVSELKAKESKVKYQDHFNPLYEVVLEKLVELSK